MKLIATRRLWRILRVVIRYRLDDLLFALGVIGFLIVDNLLLGGFFTRILLLIFRGGGRGGGGRGFGGGSGGGGGSSRSW